jgi:DNA-binding NarL/FixJ family response regulator
LYVYDNNGNIVHHFPIATGYNSGQKERAIAHLDKAIALALPDRLYGILTEYVRHFGDLLYERVALKNENAIAEIKALYGVYNVGWARLSGQVKDKYVTTNLDAKEREIAKLCAFGFTIKEIAAMLHLSESTVSHDITKIVNKNGLLNKKELAYIL